MKSKKVTKIQFEKTFEIIVKELRSAPRNKILFIFFLPTYISSVNFKKHSKKQQEPVKNFKFTSTWTRKPAHRLLYLFLSNFE